MTRINNLPVAMLVAGTLLSTIIGSTAAQLFRNDTFRMVIRDDTPVIWNGTNAGYSYTGCFTTDPSMPALDVGVNITALGRMTPEACLAACGTSSAFLRVARQARADSMHQPSIHPAAKQQRFEAPVNSSRKNNKDEKPAPYEVHPVKNGYPITAYDSDSDQQYQYAGIAYDGALDASVCTCSDGLSAASENVPDAQCDTPCDGNISLSCGGSDLLVLYNLTQIDDDPDPRGAAAVTNGVPSIGVLVGAFLLALGSSL